MPKINSVALLDFVERVSATFAFSFIGFALVTPLTDMQSLKGAALAGAGSAMKFAYVRLNIFLNKDGGS